MTTPVSTYDVLIVGGGPAGASTAIHLAQSGVRVLLVEQRKFPRAKLCGEFISPECHAHFRRLGVWDQMASAGGSEITRTDFYGRSGRRISVPSAWFGGRESWALGLSRAEMDALLLWRARAAGADVLEDAAAVGLLFDESRQQTGAMAAAVVRGVRLRTQGTAVGAASTTVVGERDIRALVTIDATGRARALARRVERQLGMDGAAAKARKPLVAFKAHLADARIDEGACEIYFYKGGYGGLNRVEGGLSNLCFIAAAGDVRARASDAERVMREIVASNPRAAETLRSARVSSEWLAVRLETFGRGELVPADGLLTVGDCAAFIDPFTGSGMLMALESGELAAHTITRFLPALRDGGAPCAPLADAYRAAYRQRFDARLRICSYLRRAAFAPRLVTEAAITALGSSARLRHALARATRKP